MNILYSHLTNRQGSHNKFYDIYTVADPDRGLYLLVTNWGRIGTSGTGSWKVDRFPSDRLLVDAGREKFYEKYIDKDYHREQVEEPLDRLPLETLNAIGAKGNLSRDDWDALRKHGWSGPPSTVRSPEPDAEAAPTDTFGAFADRVTRLLGMLDDEPTAEAFVLREELTEELSAMQARVEIAEQQLAAVDRRLTEAMTQ